MKSLAILAVVIGLALSSHSVKAQEHPTGAQLLEERELAAKSGAGDSQTPPESIMAIHCAGYLRGVMDMLGLWDAINTNVQDHGRIPACVPDEVSSREAAKVVVKYLNEH